MNQPFEYALIEPPVQSCCVLTIDLEDWFHGLTSANRRPDRWTHLASRVEQNTDRLLDILADYKVRATFFTLGRIAEEHPRLVKRIHQAGHEIGTHGHTHRRVYDLTPDLFRRELELSTRAIEQVIGVRPVGHRAPYFSIVKDSLWALDVLAQMGYLYDSSIFPTRNMLYGLPGAPRYMYRINTRPSIMELPPATLGWLPIAGGVYLRLLPAWLIDWGIRRLLRERYPVVLYLHPYDLDTTQPVTTRHPRERIVHHTNRRSAPAKLKMLLERFSFRTMQEVALRFQ